MSRRCFFAQIEPGTDSVDLSPEDSHHLQHVLRLRSGEAIELRDGHGNAWTGEIASLGKRRASVRVLGRLDLSGCEPALNIILALGLARSDTMDLVIRQATEMGVFRLAVFRADRSQYGLTGKNAEKKLDRWLKIAGEAMCQCGRTRIPQISVFEDLDRFLEAFSSGVEELQGTFLKIVSREGEKDSSLDLLRRSRGHCENVIAAVGPEGGWDGSEIQKFMNADYHPVHLGPRILRFETAAVALVSLVQLLWGDFGETGRKGSNQHEMR